MTQTARDYVVLLRMSEKLHAAMREFGFSVCPIQCQLIAEREQDAAMWTELLLKSCLQRSCICQQFMVACKLKCGWCFVAARSEGD